MPETFAPSNKNLSFGSGSCYFDRFDANGAKTGLFHFGEVSQMVPRVTDSIVDLFEHMTPARGLYGSALANRKVEWDLTAHELNRKNVAIFTAGEEKIITQTGGSHTGETLNASLTLGARYLTAEQNISSVTVKQGATTLVLGTDYEIEDTFWGMIHILPGGGATEGTAVTIDYTSAAITDQKAISPYTKDQVEGSFLHRGNPVKGPQRDYQFWHVGFFPKDLSSLISDDFIAAGITMTVYSDVEGAYGGSAEYPFGRFVERG